MRTEKFARFRWHRVAKDGISIVSRLMDEFDKAVTSEEKAEM